jgi:hypothetical protein
MNENKKGMGDHGFGLFILFFGTYLATETQFGHQI